MSSIVFPEENSPEAIPAPLDVVQLLKPREDVKTLDVAKIPNEPLGPPIRETSDAAAASLTRGNEYFAIRDFESAIDAYREAIRLDPQFSIAYSNLGSALASTGEYRLAIRNFEKASEIDPTNAHAYKSRGSVYIRLEEYQPGFEYLNLALQYAPHDPAIYASLGAAYYNLGDFNRAIESNSEEIRLHGPETPAQVRARAFVKRGFSYIKLGEDEDLILAWVDFSEAAKLVDFHEAARLDPEFQNASQIRDLLDQSTANLRRSAANLGYIESVLQPTVPDLAWALGVSRQVVHKWKAGRPIATGYAARLEGIARAASLFAGEGLQVTTDTIQRPIENGKNFFDIVREGGSPEAAARILIDIVHDEQIQRERLKPQLSDGGPLTSDDFWDLGVPTLDEKD
jgi:hypothetical protein